ncbi:VOC family protein [Streptomyces sp. NPDC055078]
MASPQKLAHVVLYSSQVPAMRDWYVKVLDGHVVYETPAGAFVTYDDEHHRIAIAEPNAAAELTDEAAELAGGDPEGGRSKALGHIAFTYATLKELLENWERLAEDSVLPFLAVNHGPTTSMYYADPDGNHIELQIDNFATVEEGTAFMQSDGFAANPFGETFDPADKLAELRAGASAEELVIPTW